jgi:Na+-driven multidrug efflux pump
VEHVSLWHSIKMAWTFLLDNSAHLEEESILPAIVSVMLSIAGMLLDALLVGLVADALGAKMVGSACINTTIVCVVVVVVIVVDADRWHRSRTI